MAMKTPALVSAVVLMIALPWGLYFRERARPRLVTAAAPVEEARHVAPGPPAAPASRTPAPSMPDPRPMPKSLDLEGLARQAAAEEQARIDAFESKLAELEAAALQGDSLLHQGLAEAVVALLEPLLESFPRLELRLIEARDLEHRATVVNLRMALLVNQAKLAILAVRPASEEKVHQDIRLRNKVSDLGRRLGEISGVPVPARRTLAGRPSSTQPERSDRAVTEGRLSNIRIDLRFADQATLGDAVAFLREVSGVNMVIRGAGTELRPVALELRDVTVDTILRHLAQQAGVAWEIDDCGVVLIGP